MQTKHFRPWYNEASRRWHGLDGRFLPFSDARPRGGVFEPGEAGDDFEMFGELPSPAPAKSRQLERRRATWHGKRGKGVESNTVTGRKVA